MAKAKKDTPESAAAQSLAPVDPARKEIEALAAKKNVYIRDWKVALRKAEKAYFRRKAKKAAETAETQPKQAIGFAAE